MNKAIIITGVTGDIGKSLARTFDTHGYSIIGIYNCNADCAKQLCSELNNQSHFFKCDLSNFENIKILMEDIRNLGYTIELLVNNAGISVISLLQDIDEDIWNNIWNTNVTSVVGMCKEIIPIFLQQNHGKIINISSVWGEHGASCEVAYSTTKGAINTFTKSLAKELAPSNIQVNAVSPGIIDTKMNNHLTTDELNDIALEIPSGKIGEVEDVSNAVYQIFNCSSYMTGQIITVDGGWTI